MNDDRKQREIAEIRALAETIAASRGLEVVEVRLRRSGHRGMLRIDIDRAGPEGVTVEDCKGVSRTLESELDDRDLISGSYTLEVSSPGIDRPIETEDDVRRNTGRRITVRAQQPLEGRDSFAGVLLGVEGGDLRLLEDDVNEEIRIPLNGIIEVRQELPF